MTCQQSALAKTDAQITKQRRKYLQSLHSGDAAFPAYDGKLGRCTRCEVTRVEGDSIFVRGHFYADENPDSIIEVKFRNGEASVVYDGEPTLMQMTGCDRDGDYYQLIPEEVLCSAGLKDEYLEELRLINEAAI